LNNWSKDFKEVIRRYDFCPSRPEFPLGELKNILGGQCVNLDAVGELKFSFATSSFARAIESLADWITAWGRAERAYRFIFPFRVDEFRQYGEYISQMFMQHQPEYHFWVVQFDKAVRKRVGSCRSLLLTDFSGFVDLQVFHFFPSGTQYNTGAPARSGGHNRDRAPCGQQTEACHKFNQGTCR
ncbi:hypothetical protein OG21DRAFT_1415910, partial [Imleria badia]